MPDSLLVLNSGSSSLKFALYDADATAAGSEPQLQLSGRIAGLGTAPAFVVRSAVGDVLEDRRLESDGFGNTEALELLLGWLEDRLEGRRLAAAGHRVAHGGPRFTGPVRVTEAVFRELEALVPLAPLHQPHNLAPIRTLEHSHPEVFQVACFDTAFHRSHSPQEQRLALPRRFEQQGVIRYGFHGLSYEFIAAALAERVGRPETGRAIVAHLGSGASMAALSNGVSIATTMGFTALDGLPMGTRCGALDPGVVLYLLQEHGMSPEAITTLLYQESGLLGVSGISGNMRTLLASREPAAREAVELFTHRVVREMGALMALLGGLDHVVFTAGIGENAAEVREGVCRGLEWIGVALDRDANAAHAERADRRDSKVAVWIIPTDEEQMIARHSLALLAAASEP